MMIAKYNKTQLKQSTIFGQKLIFYLAVSFCIHRKTALRVLDVCEENFKALPESHKKMIPKHLHILEEMRICVDFNAAMIKEITNFSKDMFENKKYEQVRGKLC